MIQLLKRPSFSAAVALLLLTIWFGQQKVASDEATAEKQAMALRDVRDEGEDFSEVRTRSGSKREISKVVKNKTHEVSHLKDFYHPAIILEDVSLEEGMEQLMKAYQTVCDDTGETVLPLKWEVNGAPDQIQQVKLQGRFLTSCKLLAMHARMTFEVRDDELVFSKVVPGPEQTRSWTVPPTFAEALPALIGQVESSEDIEPGAFLAEVGLLREGEYLSYLPSSSVIITRAGAETSNLIGSLMQMALEDPPVQIRYQLSHQVDGEMNPIPSVIALPGQKSVLEIGNEYVGIQDGEATNAFVGVSVSLESELYGFVERNSVSYERVDPPSSQQMANFEESGNLTDLDLQGVGFTELRTQSHRDDSTFELGSDGANSGPMLIVTSERIDATGTVIEGP